jgi:hypothetical protein
VIPVGPGGIVTTLTLAAVTNVPQQRRVFEQTFRMVVEPPWLLRARLGYIAELLDEPPVALGPVVEVLYDPDRGEGVFRAGVSGAVRLWHDLSLVATLLPVILSPDSLGLTGGAFGRLGLRWRWATGQ